MKTTILSATQYIKIFKTLPESEKKAVLSYFDEFWGELMEKRKEAYS